MKLGVIDVGGGLRGVYAAGVFDFCMDQNVRFDLCIGVSAGSANLASYVSGQRGRNLPFYTEYPFRREYMSLGNFMKAHSYLDLDYIYGDLSKSDGENPFDYDAFVASPTEYYAVATEARTGAVKYFEKSDMGRDRYDVLKASCAIPFVCHPYQVEGVPYFDGALGDPVPIEKALEKGCDKVVLVLTKPKYFFRTSEKDERLAARIQNRYPLAAERLRRRARSYNSGVEKALELEETGRVLIVAPEDTCGVDTLTRDREALQRFYDKGMADGAAILQFLQ